MSGDRDLTALDSLERASGLDRRTWSIAAAEAYIRSVPREALAATATHGLDEFIRVSRPVYSGHGFLYDDYKRMYERICYAARVLAETGALPKLNLVRTH